MKIRNAIGGSKIRVKRPEVVRAWGTLFLQELFGDMWRYMTYRFSTSIQNFADRVANRHDVYHWSLTKSMFDPTAFIGLYHEGDWLRFLIHRGPRLAFWCGGDILRLQKKPLWQWLIRLVKADHVCENDVEQKALAEMGIESRVHPILFFDDPENYPLSFKPSKTPHVWLTCHPGREREYGVELVEEIADLVPEVTFHVFGLGKRVDDPNTWYYFRTNIPGQVKNIIYHGQVPSEELDKMIREYHCGLRAVDFDGCPHTVTKGVLLGQWPINKIKYPHTLSYDTKEELIELLRGLKNIKKPNTKGREEWLKIVKNYPWG